MLVNRWQAPYTPTEEQHKILLEVEGLEPMVELFPSQMKHKEHRHPFNEIRIVLEGELMVNVADNQMLLRSGDKIEIPANTKHSYAVQAAQDCRTLCAFRYF